jgi:hypothetical protein
MILPETRSLVMSVVFGRANLPNAPDELRQIVLLAVPCSGPLSPCKTASQGLTTSASSQVLYTDAPGLRKERILLGPAVPSARTSNFAATLSVTRRSSAPYENLS